MAQKAGFDFRSGFLSLLKFVVFIAIIPFIAAVTISFQREVYELKYAYHHSFYFGVITYVLLNLFLTDLNWLYKFGQSVSVEFFRFWDPLSKVIPYVLPIYTLVLIGAYYITTQILGQFVNSPFWFFMIGLTFAMHIIMAARELYESDRALFKPNYLFEMTLVYIVNILLMVQLLNATALHFSLFAFVQTAVDLTQNFYRVMYLRFF
ncbi:MAG: hypothetical protein JNN05_03410 [Candidatus Omnitrophica bacterium]|nr:hypothetical protein [Candidatus Omnitrophota bacterium]